MIVTLAGCSTSQDGDGNGGGGNDGGSNDGGSNELGDPVPKITMWARSPSGDAEQFDIGELVVPNWQELGLDVELKTEAWGSLVERLLQEHDFMAWPGGWTGTVDNIDPDAFTYGAYHSSQSEPGRRNFMEYSNEEFDEYAEQQRRLYDDEERREAIYKCQEILMADQGVTPIAGRVKVEPYRADRFSEPVTAIGQTLGNFWNIMGIEPASGVSTLRMGNDRKVTSLNPFNATTTIITQLTGLIYDRLLRVGIDGVPKTSAASDWSQVDETTISVTLRDDLTFHDGEPVTTEDVKFAYDFQKANSPVVGPVLEGLESVEATGNNEMQFNLSRPSAPFIQRGLAQVVILPKHIWEGVENPPEFEDEEHIGSGPFRYEYWEPEEEVRLSRNPDHHMQANIDQFINVTGGRQSLFNLMEGGSLDGVTSAGMMSPDTVRGVAEDNANIEVVETPTHGFSYMGYQNSKAPFTDAAFRRAMAYAIPKQDVLEVVYDNSGYVAQSVITEANEFWHNPDVEEFTLDLEQARAELRDAGYGWDDNGRLHYPAE